MSCVEAFLAERIEKVKETIVAYETAIATVQADSKASYQLDTGATRILVTRQNLATVQKLLESQYNLLSTLDARVNRKGQTRVIPGW